jgi:hypothetical protein
MFKELEINFEKFYLSIVECKPNLFNKSLRLTIFVLSIHSGM